MVNNGISPTLSKILTLPSGGSGGLIQTVVSSTSTSGSTTAVIPWDATIPQNTEGYELLTATITPTSATSTLRITYSGWGLQDSAQVFICALFQDATVNAINAGIAGNAGYSGNDAIKGEFYMTAGTTSATTFKLRIGGPSGTTYWLNNPSSQNFGGVGQFNLTVEELA